MCNSLLNRLGQKWREKGTSIHQKWALSASFFFAVFLLPPNLWAVAGMEDADNAIIGSPTVECDRDLIRFRAVTKQPFHGRVYVKGEFSNPKCLLSYTSGEPRRGHEPHLSGGERSEGERMEEGSVVYVDGTRPNVPAKKIEQGNALKEEQREEREPLKRHLKNSDEPLLQNKNDPPSEKGPPTIIASDESPQISPSDAARIDAGNATTIAADSAARQLNIEDSDGMEGGEMMMENELRKLLEELQAINRENREKSRGQKAIPSHLPAFSSVDAFRGWRNFLRGKPGLDGQEFRRFGSHLTPDANGECPLVCPPCEECRQRDQRRPSEEAEDFENNGKMIKRSRRSTGTNSIDFEVPLGACNAKRDRSANPPGLQIHLTIVVTFHDSFITRVDRAYNVQCVYQELQHQNVDTTFDVSSPPLLEVSSEGELPKCEYRIRSSASNSSSGDPLQNLRMGSSVVQVGDTVHHEWVCSSSGNSLEAQQQLTEEAAEKQRTRFLKMFGLLIHNCYIEDGRSRRELIVDKKGCSLDPFILPTPTYSDKALIASAQSGVVKFPDEDSIGFQCSITVCIRDLGHCDGVTPPDCSIVDGQVERTRLGPMNSTARQIQNPPSKGEEAIKSRKTRSLLDWDLHSPSLTVIDPSILTADTLGNPKQKEEQKQLPYGRQKSALQSNSDDPLHSSSSDFCMSLGVFAALIASCTFLATLSLAVFLSLTFLRYGNLLRFLHQTILP